MRYITQALAQFGGVVPSPRTVIAELRERRRQQQQGGAPPGGSGVAPQAVGAPPPQGGQPPPQGGPPPAQQGAQQWPQAQDPSRRSTPQFVDGPGEWRNGGPGAVPPGGPPSRDPLMQGAEPPGSRKPPGAADAQPAGLPGGPGGAAPPGNPHMQQVRLLAATFATLAHCTPPQDVWWLQDTLQRPYQCALCRHTRNSTLRAARSPADSDRTAMACCRCRRRSKCTATRCTTRRWAGDPWARRVPQGRTQTAWAAWRGRGAMRARRTTGMRSQPRSRRKRPLRVSCNRTAATRTACRPTGQAWAPCSGAAVGARWTAAGAAA